MQIPFFKEIEKAQNILLAGAGGGFDIASGIPLYTYLKTQGKNVILANLSFTELTQIGSEEVCPSTYPITVNSNPQEYFPEKYILEWLSKTYSEMPIMYGFLHDVGVAPLRQAYQYLIKEHQLDTIILVDGGTDSLMFGDESAVGTIIEDACSILAVAKAGASKNYLVSIGFGVEQHLNHHACLQNIATLTESGGYLGSLSLTAAMPEGKAYIALTEYLNEKMPEKKSIVINSVMSAMQGHYGNYHATPRTNNSTQYISPLMPLQWCFRLEDIAKRISFANRVQDSQDIYDIVRAYQVYRASTIARIHQTIPLL